jgi:hypothetical protein
MENPFGPDVLPEDPENRVLYLRHIWRDGARSEVTGSPDVTVTWPRREFPWLHASQPEVWGFPPFFSGVLNGRDATRKGFPWECACVTGSWGFPPFFRVFWPEIMLPVVLKKIERGGGATGSDVTGSHVTLKGIPSGTCMHNRKLVFPALFRVFWPEMTLPVVLKKNGARGRATGSDGTPKGVPSGMRMHNQKLVFPALLGVF